MTRVSLVSAGAALVLGLASASWAISAGTAPGPTSASLRHLQKQIVGQRQNLAAQGIFLVRTELNRSCLTVVLANPTRPNRNYIVQRFGHGVCVATTPDGPLQACGGPFSKKVATGTVTVPDISDLGIFQAEKRITALGLTYAVKCLSDNIPLARRPVRSSPEALVRITAQCPRPGEKVPASSTVALQGVAPLPGGFDYAIGVLDAYNTGSNSPCQDGRNP
jgi:hypothetical protein